MSTCPAPGDAAQTAQPTDTAGPDRQHRERLGEYMKRLEAESLDVAVVHPYDTFLVRLDGWAFSRFTRAHFDKPFDTRFAAAMNAAAASAMTTFHAAAAYSHSDEVTLFFPATCTREAFDAAAAAGEPLPERMWNGRVVKLLTSMAGYVSVAFDRAVRAALTTGDGASMDTPPKAFDARLVVFPEPVKMLCHQVWRQRDCRRNAVSGVAATVFPKSATHGKTTEEMAAMVATVDPDALHRYAWTLTGSYFRPATVKVAPCGALRSDAAASGVSVDVTRTRVVKFAVPDVREDAALFDTLFVSPCHADSFPFALEMMPS